MDFQLFPFYNLPNPLDWQSFFKNDLPLLWNFCQEVRDISDQHHLNKSQIRALIKLKATSDETFQKIIKNEKEDRANPPVSQGTDRGKSNPYPFPNEINIRDLSAREIEEVADKVVRKEIQTERNRPRFSPSLNMETTILTMTRLGIPVDRIAAGLNISRKSEFNNQEKSVPVVKSHPGHTGERSFHPGSRKKT